MQTFKSLPLFVNNFLLYLCHAKQKKDERTKEI